MSERLSSNQKIKKKNTFLKIVEKGRRQQFAHLTSWTVSKNKLGREGKKTGPLLGISVSKKISRRANERNLIKRRVREVFRRNQKKINSDIAIFIKIRPTQNPPKYQEIKEELFKALEVKEK